MRSVFLVLLVFCLAISLDAQSVSIGKKTFPNVQMAINKAKPGSVIEIRGVHLGSLKLNKKGITLRGEDPEKDGLIGSQGSVISADGEYGAETLIIENLTIRGGNTTGGPGGGIMFKRVKGKSVLKNLIVTRNKSEKAAGGVFIAASEVSVENCWIHENYAAEFGGGMVLQSGNASDSEIIVHNSVISSNTSGNHGGGIYVNGNPKWGDATYLNISMENSIITYNSTGKRGGAIFIKGAVHLDDEGTNTRVDINHLTVAYNRSTDAEGRLPGIASYGVQGEEPLIKLLNSLIVANGEEIEPDVHFGKSKVLENTGNIYEKLLGIKVANVDMTSSQIINNRSSIGLSNQLTKGPGAMPELRLQSGSVAIDKANSDTALKTDINGRTRSNPDVGAVEYNQ